MTRKRFLAMSTAALVSAGMVIMTIFLGSSFSPEKNARSSEKDVVSISSMKVGDEILVGILNRPLLIHKVGSEEFKVWDRTPRFSTNIAGCAIQRTHHNGYEYPGAVYVEPCRFVLYDSGGNVLPGSHEGALPMKPVEFVIHEKNLYIQLDSQ